MNLVNFALLINIQTLIQLSLKIHFLKNVAIHQMKNMQKNVNAWCPNVFAFL